MDVSLEGISTTSLNISMIIIALVLVVGAIVGILFYIKHTKRYNQFECVIFGKDGFGQTTMSYDKAGIFIDSQTKNKRFFLKKNNVGLDPDKVPYIPTPQGKKKVFLFQDGLKNFHFLNIDIQATEMSITVGEEDVNWAVNAYERQKKIFSQSMLMQLLPFMALAFVSIIILVIFIYFFKQFPILKEVAVALKEAAIAMNGGQILQ